MKMWQGRFKKEADSSVNDFNSSISFDSRMYREDLTGSMAHAQMLGKCGIIEKSEADAIVSELKNILKDIESGKLEFSSDAEDIHMFAEQVLTERIGDTGKRLHTARSRNDQVALDIRMYIKNRIKDISNSVINLLEVIYTKACDNVETVMPGYTHLQRAQPITFAHHLCAYAFMFMRDLERIWQTYDRCDVMPLGSGAIAGTTYPIDRLFVAEKLGFKEVTLNSIDGVSDRDFILELSSNLTLLMMHLSRFSEEMILWCSSEFSFVELDDAFSTGSSIMPQKKNPDIAELVRGKTGRIYGNNTTLLTMMKSLPLAYNKDMQEDKEAIFDSIDNAVMCLDMFAKMLDTALVRKDNMRKAAGKGFINATDCADYLVKKGLPFRTAYKIVGQLVAYCIDNDKTFETLSIEEYRNACDIFEEDVYKAINLENCVSERDIIGGPGKNSVRNQLDTIKKTIEKYQL